MNEDSVKKLLSELRNEDVDDLIDEPTSIFNKIKGRYPWLTQEVFTQASNSVINQIPDGDLSHILPRQVQPTVNVVETTPTTTILKFKTSLKLQETPIDDMFKIFQSIKLDGNMIAKTMYDHPVEFTEGLVQKIDKVLIDYLYSEHKEKTLKVLHQNVVSCLYYTDDIQIRTIVSNTGVISFSIIPSNLHDTPPTVYRNIIKTVYKIISGKELTGDIEYNSINIKVVYPTETGYLVKKTIADFEKTSVVNNIIKFNYQDVEIWYSSNDSRMNFTVNDVETFQKLKGIKETIHRKFKYYIEHLTKIKGIPQGDITYIATNVPMNLEKMTNVYIKLSNTPFDNIYQIKQIRTSGVTIELKSNSEFHGNYVFTSLKTKKAVKEDRDLGLVVDSKKCEKKRRPIFIDQDITDKPVLEINGNRFVCPEPYMYHGHVDKVNCCFKLPQKNEVVSPRTDPLPNNEVIAPQTDPLPNNEVIVPQSEPLPNNEVITPRTDPLPNKTIDSEKINFKKTPLKKFTNMKMFSPKVIDGSMTKYFDSDYVLVSGADEPNDRTIQSCLEIAYGNDISVSINSLNLHDYNKYLGYNTSLEEWKSLNTKSIDDILLSISLYKKVNMLIIHEDLVVKCTNVFNFDKSLVIYRNDNKDSSYYLVVNMKSDWKYEHNSNVISELIKDYSRACDSTEIKGASSYKQVTKKQVVDFQNLVVFLEVNTGGYIAVSPSTIETGIEIVPVNEIRLLTPESQYMSLLELSKTFKELEPIGVTRGLTSKLVSGIKVINSGISPVSHQQWNGLPDAEDLFYIERYSTMQDIFQSEEENFTNDFTKVRDLDQDKKQKILRLIKKGDYIRLVNLLKNEITDISEDRLSKIVWCLINNEDL